MAGLSLDRKQIYKIQSSQLRLSKWNLNISKDDLFHLEEIIYLFDAQEFRTLQKFMNIKLPTYKLVMAVVIDKKSDLKRICSKRGFVINGVKYKRLLGTTGGLKNNTILCVNAEYIDILNKHIDCERNPNIPLVPAKLEAYKSLSCSASAPIIDPNGILVVKDCIVKYLDNIIEIDDSNVNEYGEPNVVYKENVELENNNSDGYNLCTIEYMKKVQSCLDLDYTPSGVCLRNAWLKGMLFPFPIIEFADKYADDYIVKDVWGNDIDIRNVEMILTESSLKLWNCYDSIEDYVEKYKRNGFTFSVTKIAPNILEDEREVNYQYLQSYDFTDDDIVELCKPTVEYLKSSLCGDYQSTLKFLGIDGNLQENNWQKALSKSEYMLKDPFVVDNVNRLIKKKINNAKIGKLKIKGNYQILSGDCFGLMQSIFGLEPTGLLKANECYSQYWNDLDERNLVAYRSPMTTHNNIRKVKSVNSDECKYWYKYMKTIFIINHHDSFCMALNGADKDSDLIYTTNNKVLFNNHISLPPTNCTQRNVPKKIVTEADLIQVNMNGMGNQVGSITNKPTSMKEVQSYFSKESKEYKELDIRICCSQLYQQNELDKLKGIIATKMPQHWFSIDNIYKKDKQGQYIYNERERDFFVSICCSKKPYFFIYIYDYLMRDYKKYEDNNNRKCRQTFGFDLKTLINKIDKTEEEKVFVEFYNRKHPVGFGNCAMNKICWHIENEFKNYVKSIKLDGEFNHKFLKYNCRCTKSHKEKLLMLCEEYASVVAQRRMNKQHIINSEDNKQSRKYLKEVFAIKAEEICPNKEERFDIVLDMCYSSKNNKQFCWDIIGDMICNRLEELNCDNT